MTTCMKDSTIGIDTLRVKTIREKKGLSQSKIAEMMHIEQTTYSKIENGVSKIDLERLFMLAEILEENPFDLLNYRNNNTFHINSENNIVNGHVEHFHHHDKELQSKVSELETKVKELVLLLQQKRSKS